MTFFKLAVRSLWFNRVVHLTTGLTVLIIATVLTGALFVGDSMRASLKESTFRRLGPVRTITLSDRFLPETVFSSAATSTRSDESRLTDYPALAIRGSLRFDGSSENLNVMIFGVSDDFWQWNGLRSDDFPSRWNSNEVVINQSLADKENRPTTSSKDSDSARLATLHFNESSDRLAENLFAQSDESVRRNVVVRDVLTKDQWPSSFAIFPNQRASFNVFVPLERLQRFLNQPGKVNCRFRCVPQASDSATLADKTVSEQTSDSFRWNDLGVYSDDVATDGFRFVQIKSRDFIFSDAQKAILANDLARTLGSSIPSPKSDAPAVLQSLTHLVNSIQVIKPDESPNGPDGATDSFASRETPYSLVTGIEFPENADVMTTVDGKKVATIADDEIYLNSWTADDLQVQTGDFIQLRYFAPENPYNRTIEKTVVLRLAGVLRIEGIAANSRLVPDVERLTDAESLADWNPPFPFDAKKIRPKDEEYWNLRRATPKGFVSLKTARTMFGSRFGSTTAFSIVFPKETEPLFPERFIENWNNETVGEETARLFGVQTIDVWNDGIAASRGSTPFDVLFLCFSFFIIAAILILAFLVVRFSIDGKLKEIGVLQCLGFSKRQVASLIGGELFPVLFLGAAIGCCAAFAFNRAMIFALNTVWVQAIGVAFLKPSWSFASVAVGFSATLFSATASIFLSFKTYKRLSQKELLKQEHSEFLTSLSSPNVGRPSRRRLTFLWVATLSLGIASFCVKSESSRIACFFGTASLLLAAAIDLIYRFLTTYRRRKSPRLGLASFAAANLADSPLQTSVATGLLASSLFIVFSVGLFRLETSSILSFPNRTANDSSLNARNDGGFAIVTETNLPFYQKINDFEADDSPFQPDEIDVLKKRGVRFCQLRATSGENVGCTNLYRGKTPRILGVPRTAIERGGFLWAAYQKKIGETKVSNPWELLTLNDAPQRTPSSDSPENPEIPIILDQNTATYSLRLYRGIGEVFPIELPSGQILNGKVVALLSNSLFQGEILISEENFLKYFPENDGYNVLLTEIGDWNDSSRGKKSIEESRRQTLAEISSLINRTLAEKGTATESTLERISRFNAVQNTYIAIFQSLGGLGVLLGTLGLAVVRLRNLLSRKYEFCLERIWGYGRSSLILIVLFESVFILISGLLAGTVASLVALIPKLATATVQEGFFGFPKIEVYLIIAGILSIGLLADFLAINRVLRFDIRETLRNR